MEMSGEPGLDGAVLPHELDELAALGVVGVVEPAAAVHDVVLLKDAQSRAVGRSVSEDKDLPALVGGMIDEHLLEPRHLFVVNGDLVRSVLGAAKDGGAHADQQRLVGDLAHKVRGFLAVSLEVNLEIGLVGGEFVDALQVVIAADDLVGNSEAAQKVGGHLVAFGGAGEQFRRLLGTDALGFAQVAQGADGDVAVAVLALGLVEDSGPVAVPGLVILHLAGVHVKVAQHSDGEFVRRHFQRRGEAVDWCPRPRSGSGGGGGGHPRLSGRWGGGGGGHEEDGDTELHDCCCCCCYCYCHTTS
mmetsp:Transcript_38765/g.116501  ORF Transcript_38765/g.116501 Transcript_38765/m.116501 type:complete len:302 (-) Transcript_38765:368-1273(-)